MAISNDMNNYTTVSSFATYEKALSISHSKLHLKSKITESDINLIVNSTSFGNKYFDYFRKECYLKTFTDIELIHYKFQPKKYCYDMYGSTELWSLLLKMNHMVSITDFKKKKFYTFYSSVFNLINEILVLERENITDNTESIYTE